MRSPRPAGAQLKDNMDAVAKLPNTWTAIAFVGRPVLRATCPCGHTVEIPLREIPEKDTPHPCGDPDHWLVRQFPLPAGEVEHTDHKVIHIAGTPGYAAVIYNDNPPVDIRGGKWCGVQPVGA